MFLLAGSVPRPGAALAFCLSFDTLRKFGSKKVTISL
jgi:hypothetical protein